MRIRPLLPFLLAAVLAAACGKKEQPQPPALPVEGFAPGTVQGRIYDNAAYRFRFTVPDGWRLQEGRPADSTESSVLLVAGINEKLMDTFMINAQKGFRRSRMSPLQRLEHMFAATRNIPGFRQVVQETLSVGNAPAARLEYRMGRTEGKPESFYLFVHNDRTVTFASTAPSALPAPLKGDIESILSSLEFY